MTPAPNTAALARAARRRRWLALLLYVPGLLLIGVILLLPGAWLVGTSFLGNNGLTLEHYQQLLSASYVITMRTTLELAAGVTLLCLAIGYTLAYLLTLLHSTLRTLLFCCVLFPLWTSVLVRTYAWQVILQRRGILNTWLLQWGLLHDPLQLANSFAATLIGMTHIMLPMAVLPLYASLSVIDKSFPLAAASLGASRARAFYDVTLPLSLPGIATAAILVFVVSLGFYVTPALLGGGRVTTWSMRVGDSLMIASDWGSTSAMGIVLVLVAGGVLALTASFGGLRRLLGG